jgi:hypothetical protein
MGEIVSSNMFTGFMKGFTKELGTQITAAERRKIEGQRAAALALKAENLARFKAAMAEETAEKTRQVKISEGKLERASKEKIAGIKATKDATPKPITESQAMSLAQRTGLTDTKEIKDFADRIMGKQPEEAQVIIEEKGFWGSVGSLWNSIFGNGEAEAKAPTVSSEPPDTTPATTAPTVSGIPEPTPAPKPIKSGAKQPKKVAPPAALRKLKANPSTQNLKYFEEIFGYIPEEYK